MEKLDNKIFIVNEKGQQLEGIILFTFEANGDEIVLYELEDAVYAAKVLDDNSLKPIEDDEWPLVEKIYKEYIESLEDEEDESEQ